MFLNLHGKIIIQKTSKILLCLIYKNIRCLFFFFATEDLIVELKRWNQGVPLIMRLIGAIHSSLYPGQVLLQRRHTCRSTWIGWRRKVALRDGSFSRFSPVSGAQGEARCTHTRFHTHTREKGATHRRTFWCGTNRSMTLPSRHQLTSVCKSEPFGGKAIGDRF